MTAPRHRRRLRGFKWTGLSACVIILTLWALSLSYAAWYQTDRGSVQLSCGSIIVGWLEGAPANRRAAAEYFEAGWQTRSLSVLGIGVQARIEPSWPRFWSDPLTAQHVVEHNLSVPLWLPFALFAPLTLQAWRLDRRRPRDQGGICGHAPRGATGRCPECGAAREAKPV